MRLRSRAPFPAAAPAQAQMHFFKFTPPGSLHSISIPESFIKHLDLEGENKCVLLTRCNREWAVKVTDGWVFGEGWESFVRDNGVQELDFLLFRHQGNMVFQVLVFDPSTCERDYPQPKSLHAYDGAGDRDRDGDSDRDRDGGGDRDGLVKMAMRKKTVKRKPKIRFGNHPYFEFNMAPNNIKMAELYIPLIFAKTNGLTDRNCEVVLMDEKKRLCTAKLRQKRTAVCLRGWQKLKTVNGLKAGDVYRIELIKPGEKPIMKFRYVGNQPVEVPGKSENIAMSTLNNHPCFVSTLTTSNFDKSLLYLPKEYSSSTGLRNGEMILRNENQESWTVVLRDIGKYVYIATGWSDFRVANDLKEGDVFRFELVRKGKKPIANFYRIGNKPIKTRIKAKTTMSCPCFTSVMTPLSFKRDFLYIPRQFARSNCLGKGEMILKNEYQESWTVKLMEAGKYVYISIGWIEFRAANGLKEGDRFKFELIEKGKKPVAMFTCTNRRRRSMRICSKAETTAVTVQPKRIRRKT